jgi:hypothetical protein
MPEVIVIDEIGTELEAGAARTIAERGVQLIATAHGNTLENLIMNPTLSDLIGGIQTVTLGDDEARRRGTQKSVLERKAPPTFDLLVEIRDRERVAVHENVSIVVDALLRGDPVAPTVRYRDEAGEIREAQGTPLRFALIPSAERGGARAWRGSDRRGSDPWRGDPGFSTVDRESGRPARPDWAAVSPRRWESGEMGLTPSGRDARGDWEDAADHGPERLPAGPGAAAHERSRTVRIFPFGVNRERLQQAIRQLRSPALVVADVKQADVVLTVRNYYRRKPQPLRDAEASGVPIYVLRSNAGAQIEEAVSKLAEAAPTSSEALQEAEDAVHGVLNQDFRMAELAPQNAYLRRLQHQVAERYNLASRSTGREPYRRVTIYEPRDA